MNKVHEVLNTGLRNAKTIIRLYNGDSHSLTGTHEKKKCKISNHIKYHIFWKNIFDSEHKEFEGTHGIHISSASSKL